MIDPVRGGIGIDRGAAALSQRAAQYNSAARPDPGRAAKRWRGGDMAQRWVSAALLDAEKRFRRVRGHRDLSLLATALDARSPGVTETARVT